MKLIIQTIPHKEQRYKTVGDWRWAEFGTEPALLINVSDLKDDKMNALIAIHELIEAILCRFNEPEITTEEVDKFDMSNPELEEPGNSNDAPYNLQHLYATSIERELAKLLKVNWNEYERRIKDL